jgi:hypothetical protein
MAITSKQKVDENEVVSEVMELLPVKHIVRVISQTGQSLNGSVPIGQVEQYLAEQYSKGYTLLTTHYLGLQPEGYAMMWILVA